MNINYSDIQINTAEEIPWIVQLFENPDSILPFPGKIKLSQHDNLHIFLEVGVSQAEEAYVVGCTLGLDKNSTFLHCLVLLVVAWFLYPKVYKMRPRQEWGSFWCGYRKGKEFYCQGYSLEDFA